MVSVLRAWFRLSRVHLGMHHMILGLNVEPEMVSFTCDLGLTLPPPIFPSFPRPLLSPLRSLHHQLLAGNISWRQRSLYTFTDHTA